MLNASTLRLTKFVQYRILIDPMEPSLALLSDVTIYMKYSKFLPELKRRETWIEGVTRNKNMHLKKFPALAKEIEEAYTYVYDKKVLPSMRSMQFGGKPIELSPNRLYNCAYLPIDSHEAFGEVMFLLLGGTGVGYSVQQHHVANLPDIKTPGKRKTRYLIGDSIEGWADAVKVLVKSYLVGGPTIEFDFSDIRTKGTLLKTSGGKAPGPQPLKDCIHNLRKIFEAKKPGEKLRPIEVHDMMCFIADAVLSGGIRRAALIALFTIDDEEMLTCKFGNWSETNPQRGRANNSAVVVRHKIKKKKFFEIFQKIKASRAGEPGIYFSNNPEWGTNPCCEIGLRAFQFCNLTTTNVSDVTTQEELNNRVRAAALIGTLQASYTNFHYLRPIWQETTEKEALIGVSMTGISSGGILKLDCAEAAKIVKKENKRIALLIGINPAARCTAVKPEGTGSLVVGASSGIHSWNSKYYIRRIRVNKNEPIYRYMVAKIPELVEDDYFKPTTDAILMFPVKAPEGSIFKTEPAIDLLERVKFMSATWVKNGHRKGDNTHNVSATIDVKDDEWETVGNWMWDNKKFYNGLAILPHDGGSYIQAPHTECTEYEYNLFNKFVTEINLAEISEDTDNTTLTDQAACAGGMCER